MAQSSPILPRAPSLKDLIIYDVGLSTLLLAQNMPKVPEGPSPRMPQHLPKVPQGALKGSPFKQPFEVIPKSLTTSGGGFRVPNPAA